MNAKKISGVCVYCGSSENVDQAYKDAAEALGRGLAHGHMRVVFGGGNVGLMGIVASSALAAGGEVHGIIPHHIADKERAHNTLTKLDKVDTMHERKQIMVDNSDAFVILPGGLGTMDEFFEIITWHQLGLHKKPIIIANIEGYWQPLVDLIDHLIAKGFAPESDREHIRVVNTVDEVLAVLQGTSVDEAAAKSDLI